MKNKNKLLLLVLGLICVTGCDSNSDNIDNKIKYDVTGLNHTTCTRKAEVNDDSTTVRINFDLYSDDEGYLMILESKEEIKSSNSELLDQYETAYKNVYKVYDDIKYYDNTVTRTNDKVISATTINYGKVDMEKVRQIEGEEDNVKMENGKIKLSDWKNFAKEYGTTCD